MPHSRRSPNRTAAPSCSSSREARAVGDIASHLDITSQAVSRHLKVLHEAGLVDEHRDGTRHLFLVNSDGFAAVQEFLADFWTLHLGHLQTALQLSRNPAEADGMPRD